MKYLMAAIAALPLLMGSCKSNKQAVSDADLVSQVPVGPTFVADSAYSYCEAQCAFGPRTMNSKAHDDCGEWIMQKFQQFGCEVTSQKADLNGYDGTTLHSTNIIASHKPELSERVLLCAHWDSRPWADNDPDSSNWHKPVMAADDGASGIAVMLEIARLLQQADTLKVGVDFICFDAEDWGVPQWDSSNDRGDSWALGAQHWSNNKHKENYQARYGILLDMVGGQGAHFYQEGTSKQYAQRIVSKVWAAAKVVGFGSYFPDQPGVFITDDHTPVNEHAHIPCIDIIPYYPDCQQSNFGPVWHTVNDNMEHIDRNTLQAVGQTILQVLFSEK
ncbi:MAG: M28 family peptidase [Prevotella sp.]|nr:M28 family peptidase [Prevotella sp.]